MISTLMMGRDDNVCNLLEKISDFDIDMDIGVCCNLRTCVPQLQPYP